MSCAKFLSFAALCLGLASFAVSARATQPVSDYDLEPLLRRYGGEADQIVSSDDDTDQPLETQPVVKHPASRNIQSQNRLAAAVDNLSDDQSSHQSDLEPAYLPSTTSVRAMRPVLNNSSASSDGTVHRDVRQAMASSSTTYSSGMSDNSSAYPQSAPLNPAPRSVQMQRSPPANGTNAWSGYAGNVSANGSEGTENSGQAETIGPGSMSSEGEECSSCMNDCDCFNPCGCAGWFGGADYLFVRPSFSDAQAYIQRVGALSFTDTVVQQKFDYQSSVRAFLGYRFDCGGEIRFTYWNYENNGSTISPISDGETQFFGGQLMVRADNAGESLLNTNGLNMNVYDIDYSKCCCGCNSGQANGCGSGCGCGNCCPVWTLKYSVGVRIADVRRYDNTFELNQIPEESTPNAGLINTSFTGAGPRVGLEGRRYFGCDRLSLFARANFSLLLGEYDIFESSHTPNIEGPTVVENFIDSHDRIIPEADIELGGDWQINDCLRFSAGYMFQAWWDLGAFEQISDADFPHVENSNILGFDGLFARFEYCF